MPAGRLRGGDGAGARAVFLGPYGNLRGYSQASPIVSTRYRAPTAAMGGDLPVAEHLSWMAANVASGGIPAARNVVVDVGNAPVSDIASRRAAQSAGIVN